MAPETEREPEVTAIAATRAAVLLVPPTVTVPLTVALPALIFQAVVAAAVGWLTVALPPTVKAMPLACVNELAVALAVKVKLVHDVFIFRV